MKKFLILLAIVSFPAVCSAAVDFDGDADYVDCGTSDTLNFTGDMSISCWVRTTSAAEEGIIGRYIEASPYEGWSFIQSSGELGFKAGGWADQSDSTHNDGAWHQVGVVYVSSSSTSTFYLDGAADGSDSVGNPADPLSASGEDCGIGAYNIDLLPNYTFIGEISEIAVWGNDLTAAEMLQLAKSRLKGMPLQIQPANLKGYWPLDDLPIQTGINGDTFRDLSGNGNNGTGVDADGDSAIIAETILSYPPQIQ